MNLKIYNQVFYNMVEITQLFPQYTVAQHFLHVLRQKGDEQAPYDWSDEKLLYKIEKYCEELKADLTNYGG